MLATRPVARRRQISPRIPGHLFANALDILRATDSAIVIYGNSGIESVFFWDEVARFDSQHRSVSDLWIILDSPHVTRGTRGLLEVVFLTDQASRQTLHRVRSSRDSLVVTDGSQGAKGHGIAAADSVLESDFATRTRGVPRNTQDAIPIIDTGSLDVGLAARSSHDLFTRNDWAAVDSVTTRWGVVYVGQAIQLGEIVSQFSLQLGITGATVINLPHGRLMERLPAWVTGDSDTNTQYYESIIIGDWALGAVQSGRLMTDFVNLFDSAQLAAFGLGRSSNDLFDVVDYIASTIFLNRIASDLLSVVDSTTRSPFAFARAASDAFAVSEVLVRHISSSRSANDSLSISESLITRILSMAREAVNMGTAYTQLAKSVSQIGFTLYQIGLFGVPHYDGFIVWDGPTSVNLAGRATSDSWLVVDTVIRGGVILVPTSSDTWSVVDIATGRAVSVRVASDSFSVSDLASRLVSITRSAADAWAISDSIQRQAQAFARASADISAVSDSASRQTQAFPRSSSDTISISDSSSKIVSFTRSASDTWTISDTSSRIVFTSRSSTDTSSVSDSSVRGIQNYTRSSIDVNAVSDSASKLSAFSRTSFDTSSISDSISRTLSAARYAINVVNPYYQYTQLGQNQSQFGVAYQLGVTTWLYYDYVIVGDYAFGQRFSGRIGSDTWSASDSVHIVSFGINSFETITVSDSTIRITSYSRISSDTDAISDSASKISVFTRTSSDSITFTDSSSRIFNAPRSSSDSLSVSDSTARSAVNLIKSSSDVDSVSDSAFKISVFTRTSSDAVSFTDSTSRIIQTSRSSSDTIPSISDSSTRIGGHPRTSSDTWPVSDSSTRTLALPRTGSDTVADSDSASRTQGLVGRTTSDSESVSDSATRISQYARTASDSAGTIFDMATLPNPPSAQIGRYISQIGGVLQLGCK